MACLTRTQRIDRWIEAARMGKVRLDYAKAAAKYLCEKRIREAQEKNEVMQVPRKSYRVLGTEPGWRRTLSLGRGGYDHWTRFSVGLAAKTGFAAHGASARGNLPHNAECLPPWPGALSNLTPSPAG